MRQIRLSRWRAISIGLCGLLLVAVFAVLLGQSKPDATADPTGAFLAQHWRHPIAPQGSPPTHFSAQEASLDATTCGQCHQAQYADWQHSLHSQTMTAGVLWQLRLMSQSEANACMNCHAPLAEQKALMALEHGWLGAPSEPPPDYIPASLGHQGLVCAACHVRGHERFGPPAQTDSSGAAAPHGGFTVSEAYQDSRFCAACHQFPDDGPRTNGKLREDTWRQWQASAFAEQGVTCQSCHMPNRLHQWQGIHAPKMVRQALTPELSVHGREVTARLTNSGAGHYFPTYMVPKITAQLVLVGEHEQVLNETVIGWHVDVSLQDELFDTRIPPGESISFSALLPDDLAADQQVELRLHVAPREHYERSFQSVLEQADLLDGQTLTLLQQAYQEAHATRYEALRVTLPVDQR